MKKTINLVVTTLLLLNMGFSQDIQYKKVSIAGGKAEILLPTTFGDASNANVSDTGKGICNRQCVFYEKDNNISINYDFSYDSTYVPVTDNDIPAWADKELAGLKQSPGFKYIDDGIYLQNWKNISYIKFIKKADGPDRYHMLFLTNIDDKIILFHFTCLKKHQKKWEPIADTIANSLRIKDQQSPG